MTSSQKCTYDFFTKTYQVNEIHVPMTPSLKHKFMSLMYLVSSGKLQVHDIHVPMTASLKQQIYFLGNKVHEI